MSVNKYFQPADFRLSPEPLDLLFQAGKVQQDRYDKGLEDTYNLQNLIGNIKSATFDRGFKKQLDSDYSPIISGIADKLVAGDKTYKNDLIKAASKFKTDPRIKMLEYNYDKEQDYLKDRGSLEKDQKWDDIYDSRAKFIQGRENLTPFDYTGSMGKEDYIDNFQDLMFNVAKDKFSSEGYATDQQGNLRTNEFGQLYKTGKGWETVSPKKIQDIAAMNVDAALQGKGGQYYVDRLLGGHKNLRNLSNDEYNQIRKMATNDLAKIGAKQIFRANTSSADFQNTPEGSGKQGMPDLPGFLAASLVPETERGKYTIYKGMNDNYTLAKSVLPESEEAYGATPKNSVKTADDRTPKMTSEQQQIYDKYAPKYGRTNPQKVLDRAVEDWNNRLTNNSINYPQDVKKLQNRDKLLFEQQQYVSREFIPIKDDIGMFDGKKSVQGTEIAGKIKEKGVSATNTLDLGPDNPYKLGKSSVVTFVDADGNTSTAAVKPLIGEYSQADITKNQMYDAKWNILGESEVHLINADTGKPETYKVIFDEVTDPRKLDDKGRPIKIGEKVRIVDPQSGKDIIEPVEDINEFGIPDAIQKAYKKLGE